MRFNSQPSSRPSLWLLGPVFTAFSVFAWAHRDVGFALCCSLAVASTYFHRFHIDPPSRQQWIGTAFLAWAAWMLCLVYYGTVLQAGEGLAYFDRLVAKPWLVSSGAMMQTLAIVWIWHLPGHSQRKTGPLIGSSGLLAALSCNLLASSPVTLNLLALFGGATLLALLALGGSLKSEPGQSLTERVWQSIVVLSCIAVISVGTWAVSAGLRHFEPIIDLFVIDLAQGSRYTDILGAGDRMPIQRQRRITLSRRVVATLTSTAPDRGKGAPMYLRTQVMTSYQNGQWTSDASAPQPLMGSWPPNGNSSYRIFSAFDDHASNAPVTSKDRHDVRLLVNLRGAVPLPYSAQRVSTPATLSCMITAEDLLQCTPAAQLVAYRIEHQAWRASIPYGIGAALHPRSRATSESGFLHAVKRARSAPEDVLARLRPLARQRVGPEPLSPLAAAQKLQDYLRHQYGYSLDVNLAKEGDPIVDFVLHRRPAYCEYFASGMVLLLRALDIPARVVGGFVVGEYNPLIGQWIVRQRDAHAWAEVFDAASGRWVAFDATPRLATQALRRKGLLGLLDQGLAWTELHLHAVMSQVDQADFKTGLKYRLRKSMAYLYRPYPLAISGIIAALAWLLIRWRQGRLRLSWHGAWRRRKHRSPGLHPDPTAAEAQQQFARVALILEQWGWPIGVSETLQDYLDRVTTQCHASGQADTALVPALHHFAQAYTRLRFQPSPANPETAVFSTTQEQLTRLQYWADQLVQIGTAMSHLPSPE